MPLCVNSAIERLSATKPTINVRLTVVEHVNSMLVPTIGAVFRALANPTMLVPLRLEPATTHLISMSTDLVLVTTKFGNGKRFRVVFMLFIRLCVLGVARIKRTLRRML